MVLFPRGRLTFCFEKVSSNKVNSIKDRWCVVCLSFFYCFAKELKGIAGTRIARSVDNPVP